MRYFIALVVILFAMSSCTSNPSPTNTAANANSNTAPETDLRADPIVNLEKKALDDIMKKNFGDFKTVLAPEYISVSPMGVYDAAATVEDLKKLSITYLTLTNWRVIKLGSDATIVVYSARIKGTYKGQPIPDDSPPLYSSSVWVNNNGTWQSAFHQECDATKPATETSPSPGGKSRAASSPSPKPSPKQTPKATEVVPPASMPSPTSDAIANEKILWETLKTQNWDGFASLLDEDAIEIEPDGINTKSDSVGGVRNAGNLFSTLTTSGFKSMRLGESAVLVTYESHLAGPKPVTYRETTVWANRNGQWVAILHHGTEVMASGAGNSKHK